MAAMQLTKLPGLPVTDTHLSVDCGAGCVYTLIFVPVSCR